MKKSVLCFILIILISSCTSEETFDIGMLVSLTGNYSPLLTSGRNGALLAVEEINSSEGWRKINLIVKDDESDSEVIVKRTEELLQKEIDFLIFSTTSGAYQKVETLINQYDVLAVSPTVSSDLFNNKDDNFIRTVSDASGYAEALGGYTVSLKKNRIAVIYDTNNLTYAKNFLQYFYSVIDDAEHQTERMQIEYNSTKLTLFTELGQSIMDWSPDAILLIAGPFDAALICQHLHSDKLLKLLSPWSISDELIENGGRAVEGIITYINDDPDNYSEEYLGFAAAYVERFGKEPSYQSLANYDTVRFLYSTLKSENSMDPQVVKQSMLKSGGFKGLNYEYEIDEYGDCSYPLVLHTVRNGKLVKLR